MVWPVFEFQEAVGQSWLLRLLPVLAYLMFESMVGCALSSKTIPITSHSKFGTMQPLGKYRFERDTHLSGWSFRRIPGMCSSIGISLMKVETSNVLSGSWKSDQYPSYHHLKISSEKQQPSGGFHKLGVPPRMDGLCQGQSQSKMDDNCGYLHDLGNTHQDLPILPMSYHFTKTSKIIQVMGHL